VDAVKIEDETCARNDNSVGPTVIRYVMKSKLSRRPTASLRVRFNIRRNE